MVVSVAVVAIVDASEHPKGDHVVKTADFLRLYDEEYGWHYEDEFPDGDHVPTLGSVHRYGPISGGNAVSFPTPSHVHREPGLTYIAASTSEFVSTMYPLKKVNFEESDANFAKHIADLEYVAISSSSDAMQRDEQLARAIGKYE